METPRLMNIFFIVLSILTYCIQGLVTEDNFPAEENATAEIKQVIVNHDFATDLEKLVNANNEFSMKLHRSLTENSWRNVFFSPTSLFFTLGMLYVGAQGKTKQELSDFLGFSEAGLSDEEVKYSYYKLLTEVLNSSENFTLKTANAILLNHQLDITSNYQQSMNFFNGTVLKVNFQQNTNGVVQVINGWIRNQTDGKIPKFLEDLDPSTVMMILNAVYFKGLWSIQFKKHDTVKGEFYNHGGTAKAKLVDMMQMSEKILYTSSSDWQMVELPYKGDRISMVIILPKRRDGLEAVENKLTPAEILEYRSKMRTSTVNLTLPKFKIDSRHNLDQNLVSLGLGRMFQNDADFSGMVRNLPVRVSKVKQKAVVEVNEEGTVATAATGVYLVPLSLSLPHVFKVDHPFFFVIMDKKTNLILFSGRVIRL